MVQRRCKLIAKFRDVLLAAAAGIELEITKLLVTARMRGRSEGLAAMHGVEQLDILHRCGDKIETAGIIVRLFGRIELDVGPSLEHGNIRRASSWEVFVHAAD